MPGGTRWPSCDVDARLPGQTAAGRGGRPASGTCSRCPSDESQLLTGTEVDAARADFDPQTGAPDRHDGLQRDGRRQSSRRSPSDLAERGKTDDQAVASGPDAGGLAQRSRSTSRSSSTASSRPGRRSTSALPERHHGRQRRRSAGLGSAQEAKDIALVLQTGSLPVKFEPLSETPGLGHARRGLAPPGPDRGHRRPGHRDDLPAHLLPRARPDRRHRAARSTRALFYGLILLIPITMTLPGIAGIILTIGVAADANVVIFERIKEEVRAREDASRAAISSGYSKGFRTIVDANVVTLITAGVLFVAGTGSVKGFAFLLALGVARLDVLGRASHARACSACCRQLQVVQQRRASWARAPQAVRWHIDIVGRTKLWFAISGVAIADQPSARWSSNGLNLGIDFEGGTRINATLGAAGHVGRGARRLIEGIDPASTTRSSRVRARRSAATNAYTDVQDPGRGVRRAATSSGASRRASASAFGGIDEPRRSAQVSASFGREILRRRDPRGHLLAAADRRLHHVRASTCATRCR